MSNRQNLNTRLNYRGGSKQLDRMNIDKLNSLKKALLHSYQAATAILSDGREFKCLINPNKLSLDVDNKILSIPFKDVRLNNSSIPTPPPENDNSVGGEIWEDMEDLVAILTLSDEGQWKDMESDNIINPPKDDFPTGKEENINIKEGDVITWKENGSHWIIYLRRLEETAYFRADIRRCRYQLVLGNGSKYWAYVRGPVEQSILWTQTSGNYFNKLNYTLIMYIQQNEETLKYFRRFKKVMINEQPWEVQATDSISTPGIIEVSLKETYNNTIEVNIEKAVEEATKKEVVKEQNTNEPYIYGSTEVYPYDIKHYEIKNYSGGSWSIWNESRPNIVKLKNISDNEIDLHIITGKSGKFTLVYESNEGKAIAALDIQIKSL